MNTALITFWELEESPFLGRLRQVIEESQLKYSASHLQAVLKIDNEEEMYWAIQKAIKTVKTLKLNSRNHFQRIYCAQNNLVIIDWRLSSLAYLLVLLNCDSEHPLVAQAQLELIRDKIDY